MKSKTPLDYSIGQTYLTWIIGLFSVIMTMVLTIFFAIYEPETPAEVTPNFTIGIPFIADNQEQSEALIAKVSTQIKALPYVKKVQQIERNEIIRLLTPRMVDAEEAEGFDLAAFFDITTAGNVDKAKMKQDVKNILPGVTVEDYKQWRLLVREQNNAFKILAASCVVVIMIMIMVLVRLVTKLTLSSYGSIVDTLRLIGADKSFICSQFQNKNFISCLKGGLLGLLIGLSVVYGITFIPKILGFDLTIKPLLSIHFLPVFVMLLLMLALIGIIVSRSMVKGMLEKVDS